MLSVASGAYKGLKGCKITSMDRKLNTQRIKGIHAKEPPGPNAVAGIPNLPSDNIGDVMKNQFLKDYMTRKVARDEEL